MNKQMKEKYDAYLWQQKHTTLATRTKTPQPCAFIKSCGVPPTKKLILPPRKFHRPQTQIGDLRPHPSGCPVTYQSAAGTVVPEWKHELIWSFPQNSAVPEQLCNHFPESRYQHCSGQWSQIFSNLPNMEESGITISYWIKTANF